MSLRLIQQYRSQVQKLIRYGGSRNESALRKAFQDLLESHAGSKNLLLVSELEIAVGQAAGLRAGSRSDFEKTFQRLNEHG